MKVHERNGGCSTNIRHWWTAYGLVTNRRAVCGHCRAIHSDIIDALNRGMFYARLHSPAEGDDYVKDAKQQKRDVALINRAIERVSNERRP